MVVFCKINDVRLLHRGLEITNKVSENRHNVGLWSSPIIIPGKHHDDAGQTNEPLCSKLAAAGQQAHGSRCLSNEISRARVTVQSPLAARPAPPLASWDTKAKKKKKTKTSVPLAASPGVAKLYSGFSLASAGCSLLLARSRRPLADGGVPCGVRGAWTRSVDGWPRSNNKRTL